MWVVPMKNLPNLLCQHQTAYSAVAIDPCFELLVRPGSDSTCEHGPYYSGQLVSGPRIGMSRLTDLDRAHALGQLLAGITQNHVAALFGVSPTISKLTAKFHIGSGGGSVMHRVASPSLEKQGLSS